MLASTIYCENIVGFIIDEAHCIKKWLAQGIGIYLFIHNAVCPGVKVSGPNFLI